MTDHEPADATRSLASQLAHELKNPVMAIQGLSSTAARLYEDMSDAERREFFRLINQEAARLIRVADQVATAITVDSGELDYLIRPEQLDKIILSAIEAAGTNGHPIEPEAGPNLSILCDARRTRQVLVAGIENAANYSSAGSPIVVRAKQGPDPHTATVEVEDRGPGLSPAERERVFDRYVAQRPPGYEDVPGAGLSLFIARAHIEAQGGRIWLEAGKEVGTILKFTLPLGMAKEAT